MTDVTDETPTMTAGAAREGGGDPLKEALDKITAEVIEKLATFGGRVQAVLHGVMKRWNHRIQGLLDAMHPGAFATSPPSPPNEQTPPWCCFDLPVDLCVKSCVRYRGVDQETEFLIT